MRDLDGAHGVSRRAFLKRGAALGGALFVAACGGTTTTPGRASGPPGDGSWAGVTLHNMTGGFMLPYLEIGLREWKTATGGDAIFDNLAYNDKQTRIEKILATEDPSWDLIYSYDEFVQQYGARLLIPIAETFGDTSDFLESSIRALSTPDGVLRALPLYEFPAVWSWNKAHFSAIGEDGENPPDTWAALFALVPKWKAKGIVPSVQPWLGDGGAFAASYFKGIYNSTGEPMFNADRTKVGFGGEAGLLAFQTIEAGFRSGFWGPDSQATANEQDAYELFGEGNVATVVWSDTPRIALAPEQQGIRQFPGIRSGTTGSIVVVEGLGISRWSRQIDAAASFARTTWAAQVAREAALSTNRYPVARRSVLADPEVMAALPQLAAYQAQGQGETSGWAAPFRYAPVFDKVIRRMAAGELDAAAAQRAAVEGTEALIAAWVSG